MARLLQIAQLGQPVLRRIHVEDNRDIVTEQEYLRLIAA